MNRISVYFLVLGIVFMIVGTNAITNLESNPPSSKIVPCYDRYHNVIQEVTCIKEVAGDDPNSRLAAGFTFIVCSILTFGFVIWRESI